MSDNKFFVIKFTLDESIEHDPTSWLVNDSKSVLSPCAKPKNFLKHKQTPDSVPDSAWPTWEVDFVKSYDTTEKADKRVRMYIKSSDNESSSVVDTLIKKRRGRSSEVSSVVINPFPEPTSSIYSQHKVFNATNVPVHGDVEPAVQTPSNEHLATALPSLLSTDIVPVVLGHCWLDCGKMVSPMLA
ncbi:unnamed protein product [Orchesella dallaii]|uniref:Uncharacterized protein n=1 Tax=Orchesella dallaii TaxID=48710 RepID=A0ABP1QH86_9HEXA